MAYANALKKEVLNFEPNETYELALKYPTGKQVSNGRIMFSTVNDEVFFLDPMEADRIDGLQLAPQEKFRLIRKGAGRSSSIEVSKDSSAGQPVVRQSAPSATVHTPQESTRQVPQSQDNSFSRIMASSYIAAIDALMTARDYAESKGIPFKLSPAEVRASAHCIYISATRQGVR